MKGRRGLQIALAFVAWLALLTGCKTGADLPTHQEAAGKAALMAEADELEHTTVTPHLEQVLEPGKNVLWCSTFQLAWNELCALLGEPVHWENEPPMVAALNKKTATKDDLDEASYVAMAGYVGDGIIRKIEKALKKKFKGQASPELLPARESVPGNWWVTYAYLWKHLPFEWAFTRFEYPLSFGDSLVESFGIYQYDHWQDDEVKMASQVFILDYKSNDDFIIEVKTRSKADRLILAKIAPVGTLAQTVVRVRRRIADVAPTSMQMAENLEVPVLDFAILREYTELMGNGSRIVIAKQKTRFRLDETGAVLKSEALGGFGGGPPRRFVFDKPFLILLERHGAKNPYFALWVGNAELLVPFEGELEEWGAEDFPEDAFEADEFDEGDVELEEPSGW